MEKKFKIHEIEMMLDQQNDCQLLIFSDLHISESFDFKILKNLYQILYEAVVDAKQETFILFGGDLLDSTSVIENQDIYDKILKWFQLLANLPHTEVIVTKGNHDSMKKVRNRWRQRSSAAFFQKIDNIKRRDGKKTIRVLENDFYIKGDMCFMNFEPNFNWYEKDHENESLYVKEAKTVIEPMLEQIEDDKVIYFMTHSPSAIEKLLSEVHGSYRIQFFTSGHQHNGLVGEVLTNAPGNFGIVSAQCKPFPQNVRGMVGFEHCNGHITYGYISGGITKLAASQPLFLHKLDRIYKGSVAKVHIKGNKQKTKTLL